MRLAERRARYEARIQLYNDALDRDALNPLPDISLDGESTARQAWREGLEKQIDLLEKRLAALRPPAQLRLNIETI